MTLLCTIAAAFLTIVAGSSESSGSPNGEANAIPMKRQNLAEAGYQSQYVNNLPMKRQNFAEAGYPPQYANNLPMNRHNFAEAGYPPQYANNIPMNRQNFARQPFNSRSYFGQYARPSFPGPLAGSARPAYPNQLTQGTRPSYPSQISGWPSTRPWWPSTPFQPQEQVKSGSHYGSAQINPGKSVQILPQEYQQSNTIQETSSSFQPSFSFPPQYSSSSALFQPQRPPTNNWWTNSYTRLPGSGSCYNQCKNRCSSYNPYNSCKPSCSVGCNMSPSCQNRQQVNNQGTTYCGSRNLYPVYSNFNNNAPQSSFAQVSSGCSDSGRCGSFNPNLQTVGGAQTLPAPFPAVSQGCGNSGVCGDFNPVIQVGGPSAGVVTLPVEVPFPGEAALSDDEGGDDYGEEGSGTAPLPQ